MIEKLKSWLGKFRITSVDTPIGGISWEYKDADRAIRDPATAVKLKPDVKLKVFVSSICGKDKYDKLRINLKNAIEGTGIADVYLFEDKGASTLKAGDHYLWALEDSDICIFLIDNKDGVTQGVQKEIDKARINNIKSFYYFCDENMKEKTALEKSLKGAEFAKSKTVHKFEELEVNGFSGLINDVLLVYHYYCRGKFDGIYEDKNEYQSYAENADALNRQSSASKSILSCNNKTKDFILSWAIGHRRKEICNQDINALDEWSCRFLKVLFEAKSIKEFNLDVFLSDLRGIHSEQIMKVIELRWKAIQKYFLDDVNECIRLLKDALKIAKETRQPDWIVQDILIDLRNIHYINCAITNIYSISEAQNELTESENEVYYPVMDRLHENLDEIYLKDIYSKRIENPNVVKLGSSAEKCADSIAKTFITAICYGSLTHILLFYNQMQNYLEYLIDNSNDWSLRVKLLALVIFDGKTSDVKKITSSNHMLLNNIASEDAVFILEFCDAQPISYKRFRSKMIALGTVGYLLNDEEYSRYEKEILTEIEIWVKDDSKSFACGSDIFYCLAGVSYRMSQDTIISICCSFLENHLRRWYTELFKFMYTSVDISKSSEKVSGHLIQLIIAILDDEKDREQISYEPSFLWKFRKQNKEQTEHLDLKIKDVFPAYYSNQYHMETSYDSASDAEDIIEGYIDDIKDRNVTQGKDGVYKGFATREIATIRNLISYDDVKLNNNTVDSLIFAVKDTLMISKESISTKVDAVSLLICIIVKCPDAYERNKFVFEELFDKRSEYDESAQSIFLSNIDTVALKVSLCVLFSIMGHDVYADFIEEISLVRDNAANILEISRLLLEYYVNFPNYFSLNE